jgi:uncharacterized XkdX family phage protein
MALIIDYELVKEYYQAELWSKEDVQTAAKKGYITTEQAKEIIGEEQWMISKKFVQS